jgi:hypothetical protein
LSSVHVNLNSIQSLNSLNGDKLVHHIRAYLNAADKPFVSLHIFHTILLSLKGCQILYKCLLESLYTNMRYLCLLLKKDERFSSPHLSRKIQHWADTVARKLQHLKVRETKKWYCFHKYLNKRLTRLGCLYIHIHTQILFYIFFHSYVSSRTYITDLFLLQNCFTI